MARGQGPPSSLGLRMASAELGYTPALRLLGRRLGLLPAEGPQQRCMHMGKGPHLPLLWASGWGRNGGVGWACCSAGLGRPLRLKPSKACR